MLSDAAPALPASSPALMHSCDQALDCFGVIEPAISAVLLMHACVVHLQCSLVLRTCTRSLFFNRSRYFAQCSVQICAQHNTYCPQQCKRFDRTNTHTRNACTPDVPVCFACFLCCTADLPKVEVRRPCGSASCPVTCALGKKTKDFWLSFVSYGSCIACKGNLT